VNKHSKERTEHVREQHEIGQVTVLQLPIQKAFFQHFSITSLKLNKKKKEKVKGDSCFKKSPLRITSL
jgi:hypothetical protein